jgi:hypothetical protein
MASSSREENRVMASINSDNRMVKNSELLEYDNVLQSLNKWSVPMLSSSTIYKTGMFSLFHKYAIKTTEQTICLEEQDSSLNLLTIKDLQNYMIRYKFVHIGCVQIAFKPLTLLGMNNCIQASLRDGRCLDWTPSLMGVVETSLSHGPVYFNVYPNLTLSLTDRNLTDSLNLRIQTQGYNFKAGSEAIAIVYRVYYKVMNTLAPNVLRASPYGHTVLIDTNLTTSKVATPRKIDWSEIKFPETWTIPQAIQPRPILNQSIENIVEELDGTVRINFNRIGRSNSARTDGDLMINRPASSINSFQTAVSRMPSRHSVSTVNRSNNSSDDLILEGNYISDQQIPHGIYVRNEANRPTSPTVSEVNNFRL